MLEEGNLIIARRYIEAIGGGATGTALSECFAVFLQFRDGKIVSQRNYD